MKGAEGGGYDACAELAPCSSIGHAHQVKNETFATAVVSVFIVNLQRRLTGRADTWRRLKKSGGSCTCRSTFVDDSESLKNLTPAHARWCSAANHDMRCAIMPQQVLQGSRYNLEEKSVEVDSARKKQISAHLSSS